MKLQLDQLQEQDQEEETIKEDKKYVSDLLKDKKELAEHLMLIRSWKK